MDWVHEGVHGPGPQRWSMDLGSMFCIHPTKKLSFDLSYYTFPLRKKVKENTKKCMHRRPGSSLSIATSFMSLIRSAKCCK